MNRFTMTSPFLAGSWSTLANKSESAESGLNLSYCQMGERCSVRDAQLPVDEAQQPQRADHQELHILEERRPLALVVMPDELTDPRHNEQTQAQDPQRPGQRLQPGHGSEHHGNE